MPFHLDDSIALLQRTPAALNALLRDLPETWTQRNEGPGTWTAWDVIGHLNHCERADWMPRARQILTSGNAHPFGPFDREAHKQHDQGKPLAQLLDEFAQLRAQNLAELRSWNLQPQDFERRGLHPILGSVTLGELLATLTVHDLSHLHQLSRLMSHQYQEAVGPWVHHLGVLQCKGHSA